MPSLLSPTLSLSSSHIFSFLNVHPTSMILPPIHPSISSYIHFSSYASIYQFIHPFFILPSIYQFIHPFSSYSSIYQFIHPFFILCIHLSVHTSIFILSIHLSVHTSIFILSIHLSVHTSIFPPIHPFIHIPFQ